MQISERLANASTGLASSHSTVQKRNHLLQDMQIDAMELDEDIPTFVQDLPRHLASEGSLSIASIDDSLSMSESEEVVSERNFEQLNLTQLKKLLEIEDQALLKQSGISADESKKAMQAGHDEIQKMRADLSKLSKLPSDINAFIQLSIHHKMTTLEQMASEENLIKLQNELHIAEEVVRRHLDKIEVIPPDQPGSKQSYAITLELDGKKHLIKADSEEEVRKKAENLLCRSPEVLCKEIWKEREKLEKLSRQQTLPVTIGKKNDPFKEDPETVFINSISATSSASSCTGLVGLAEATGGVGVGIGALSAVSCAIAIKNALMLHQRSTSLQAEAAKLREYGYIDHAIILEAYADKCLKRSLGLGSQASMNLLRALTRTTAGALVLIALCANINPGVVMGLGLSIGALGVAIGSINAGLNIRNLVNVSAKTTDVNLVMNHLLQRHALLPGTEDEVKLGLKICNMVRRKQQEKFFGNTTGLTLNTLMVAAGVATIISAASVASMGAVAMAIGGTAATLALARWYVIHQRAVRSKERQNWLDATEHNLDTNQGLYISLYFQLKSELKAREKLKQNGIDPCQSPSIFCDEICPLLGIDPQDFVNTVDGLAENFRQRMEVQHLSIVKGLVDRQNSDSPHLDPVLTGRVKKLQESGEFGAMYRPDGLKTYKAELVLQDKIERKRVAIYKIEVKTEELLSKGKVINTCQQLQALNKKLGEYQIKVNDYEAKLAALEEVHRIH